MMNKRKEDAGSETVRAHSTDNSAESTEHESDTGQGLGGRGWHGNSKGHAAAGSKGGRKVSQDREHMASIGRKGGQTVSRDRQHMAEIGRKGGQSRSEAGGEGSENSDASER